MISERALVTLKRGRVDYRRVRLAARGVTPLPLGASSRGKGSALVSPPDRPSLFFPTMARAGKGLGRRRRERNPILLAPFFGFF